MHLMCTKKVLIGHWIWCFFYASKVMLLVNFVPNRVIRRFRSGNNLFTYNAKLALNIMQINNVFWNLCRIFVKIRYAKGVSTKMYKCWVGNQSHICIFCLIFIRRINWDYLPPQPNQSLFPLWGANSIPSWRMDFVYFVKHIPYYMYYNMHLISKQMY